MPDAADAQPFATLTAVAAPSTGEFALPPDAGVRFADPEHGEGRIVLLTTPRREAARTTMIVQTSGWSVGFHLTSGQLHRLANGLTGRGRRNTIRPSSLDEEFVHVGGTPEQLTVAYREHTVTIPAGPARGLGKAIRAFEQQQSA